MQHREQSSVWSIDNDKLMTSEKKSNRGTHSAKSKEISMDPLFVPDEHLLLVYHAEFHQHYLLLCLQHCLILYDLSRRAIHRQRKIRTHCAVFIPFTPYIALASVDREGRACMIEVWNYQKDTIDSRMKLSFEIENLKASHRCLILSSLCSLYVVHFPSLKPIYNGRAGNGFSIIYDISKEGLTIVHSTQIKGEVAVRNFTNKETNRCITFMRTNSNQISDRIRLRSTRRLDRESSQVEQEQVKEEIHIKAHHENVCILRLSPNGYRFVSGSTKGTVLRLYSCLNGQLMSQFQACHMLTTIVDVNFIPQGNAIVCLNNQNHVRLFHTKMSQEEIICESVRRGKEVYQQDNPSSWLSFLGFIKEEWRYEQPFSYFNLQSLSTKQVVKEQVKVKASQQVINMSEIKEQHEKESFIIHEQGEHHESHEIQQVHTEELNMAEIVNNTNSNSNPRNSHSNSDLSKHSKSLRMSSAMKKKASLSPSIKTMVKRQAEVTQMNRERTMNFRGSIMFQNHINVRVFKGKYYYQLKYDPFNGGEMMSKQTKLNIFDVLQARGL